jgi:RNA polymerase sigma-70 factor (ECF subfamily)
MSGGPQSPAESRHGSPSRSPHSVDQNRVSNSHGTDEHVFDTLFRTYYSRLCTFARRYVHRPDVAEEVVADVFVHLWKHRARWPELANKRRYLYAAVRNQALKHIAHERVVRTAHKIVAGSSPPFAMSQPSSPVDEEVQAKELAAALEAAINKLPPRCKRTYILHRQYGMSHAEIARLMGVSVRTVETQVARAKHVLRRIVETWYA